ncbi:10018_t:CDS:2 [Dentiscutata heterogama]|uniref:10018_t:CDS:1 n=1 Tax=Dentiscutata heterogama TaxID=1316150 RepID=A0ACA9MCH4_9GLOM|nr:10018_t:CDS:2 [Dentiscutata heterogama]
MASIKVLHGSIARRFTVPNDTTWSSFESQIRSLFYIPSQTPISLSYTDEDGDIITLSSDLELQEILSDQELFGSSVKFVLSTPDELAHNEKNSWVLEGSTSQINEEELSKSIKDNDVISFSSSDEEDGLETSHESREQSSNESQQQPFVFTEFSEFQKNSNYKHVTVTDEETEEPTFKPTIVSQQPETIGESSSSSTVEEEKSKELPEKEEKQPESDQSTDNNNEENIFKDSSPIRYTFGHNDDEEEKFGSCNEFGFRRRFGRCHNRRFNRNNQCCQRRESCNGNISEEGVAEKVKILRDMGFEGENFEELVKLYNGNIDFVVEALLQR